MLPLATSTAADFTAFTMQEEKRQRAARAVTEEALRRGSVDNVSVILVALNHGDGDDVDDDDRPGSAGAAEEVD